MSFSRNIAAFVGIGKRLREGSKKEKSIFKAVGHVMARLGLLFVLWLTSYSKYF